MACAVFEDGDAVGQREGLFLIVRDVYGRDTQPRLQLRQLLPRAVAQFGVEIAEGFVEQQYPRTHRERPRQGHALLLAAAQLGHVAFSHPGKLHQFQRLLDPRCNFGFGHLAGAQPEGHVFEHVHVRKQGIALKHHGGVASLGGEMRDIAAVERDRSRVGRLESGRDAQRGRFAASARAQQGEELSLGDIAGELADPPALGKRTRHVVKLHRAHGAPYTSAFHRSMRVFSFAANSRQSMSMASMAWPAIHWGSVAGSMSVRAGTFAYA